MDVLLAILVFLYAIVQAEVVGYVFHRLMHSPRLGALHAAHMEHHSKQYPANDCLSDKYRNPEGVSTTVFLVPLIILIAAAHMLLLPPFLFAWYFWGTLLTSLANLYIHDRVHLKKIWLKKYRWFRRLQARHRIHHIRQDTNYGILQCRADCVFGTYYKKKKST